MNFGSSLSLVLSAGLLSAVSLFAQPNDEWNGKPRIFGVNRLNPHVTSMPYTTVEEAVKGDRHASEWYRPSRFGMVPDAFGRMEILPCR